MQFAKWVFNICIVFFIVLAIYFKVMNITSYDWIDSDAGITESIVTWKSLLFFALVMISCRILIELKDRKQQVSEKEMPKAAFSLDNLDVDTFASLDKNQRLLAIVQTGKQSNKKTSLLFQYAIQSDPDLNVRLGALKRVHFFENDSAILEMMQMLKKRNDSAYLEPYFSMALHRMGLITTEELTEKLNPQ